jgi:hypothetical protein
MRRKSSIALTGSRRVAARVHTASRNACSWEADSREAARHVHEAREGRRFWSRTPMIWTQVIDSAWKIDLSIGTPWFKYQPPGHSTGHRR